MVELISHEFHHENGTKITVTDIPVYAADSTALFKVLVIVDEIRKDNTPRSVYSFNEFGFDRIFCSECGCSNSREKFYCRGCGNDLRKINSYG